MVSECCPLSRDVLRPEQGLQSLPFSRLQTPDSPVIGSQVVMDEVLLRDPIKDSLEDSPYYLGATFGSALWVAYAWITRLRHGVLPDTTLRYSCFYPCAQSDVSSYLPMHIAFLLSFGLFMLAIPFITFRDPGTCVMPTKDALKSVRDTSPLFTKSSAEYA